MASIVTGCVYCTGMIQPNIVLDFRFICRFNGLVVCTIAVLFVADQAHTVLATTMRVKAWVHQAIECHPWLLCVAPRQLVLLLTGDSSFRLRLSFRSAVARCMFGEKDQDGVHGTVYTNHKTMRCLGVCWII